MRKERGWSRAELARRAGLHYRTVQAIEGGEVAQPYYHTVVELMRAFGYETKFVKKGTE